MRTGISKTAIKQFEIKGYEQMIGRIMEGSLKANPDLQDQFISVQEALAKQKEFNDKMEVQMDSKIKERQAEMAIEQAPAKKEEESGSEYYDSEYESENDEND